MASLVSALGTMENMGLFDVILPLILIFALIFGVLEKTKIISDKAVVNVIIASAIAFIFTSFIKAGRFLRLMTPMIIGMLVVLLFIFLIFRFIGVKEEQLVGAFKKSIVTYGLVIGLVILFVFVAMNTAFPELTAPQLQPRGTMNASSNATMTQQQIFQQQMSDTLLNPVVIAMIVMLLTFTVAAFMIVRKN